MVAWRPKHVATNPSLNIDWLYNYIVFTETSTYYLLGKHNSMHAVKKICRRTAQISDIVIIIIIIII
jgi:formylmethanofuran dehydrogenase subunit E-like metal-binding protein